MAETKHTATGDWTTTTNTLNQQQDSTTDTNSTKRIWNEIAKAKKVLGQRKFFFVGFSWTLGIWRRMNLRGKRRVIPHGKPEIWYHLMKTRPDLLRGKGTFDWWRSWCWWSSFKSTRFEPCNRYTTAPLVINKAQLDWPRQEGFSCKRIKGHKQEDINTQSDITNINEANQRGVRELDSIGLIDTVEEIKNGGPGSL